MIPRSILVLTHELPPLGGGAGRAMAQLCMALQERGLDVTVWTQEPPAAVRREFPFRVRYFATGRRIQFQTSVPTILLYSVRILASGLRLGPGKPDLIFSNTALPTGCIGAFLARVLGVPHAIWYHGADVHQNRREGAGFLYRLMLKAAWRNTVLHAFVSRGLLRMAEGYGGMDAPRMVLPLFADHIDHADPSDPIDPIDPARGALPFPAPERAVSRTFLFTGRLEAVKNPFLLLDAVGRLRDSRRLPADVRFRIVGGGALFEPLRKRIEAAGLEHLVSLEPPVPGEAMGGLYGEAFALVLTSVVEGFPLTILEAARCGVPSLGPDTLGINEVIEDGRTGILFPPDDPEACAGAMLRLLEEKGLRGTLGGNARVASLALSSGKSADLFLDALRARAGGR